MSPLMDIARRMEEDKVNGFTISTRQNRYINSYRIKRTAIPKEMGSSINYLDNPTTPSENSQAKIRRLVCIYWRRSSQLSSLSSMPSPANLQERAAI